MVEKGEYFWSKHAKGFLDSLEFVVGKPILEIINKALSEEKNLGKVVDFGCGTGIFTKIIAQNSESVIAVDIS
jgi:ABC-2 type transport system ATP-binding protein